MKRDRHVLRILTLVFSLTLLGLAWLTLAPIQIGGPAAYVIVAGNSMEPRFKRGDLIILHRAANYHIGDIATYRHPEIGPIIHRIIDQDGDHFIFKGDHNSWIDSYRPVQAEIIGKFWLHLPTAGKMITYLRQPWPMAIMAGGIGLVLATTILSKPTNFPRRHRRQKAAEAGQPAMSYWGENKTDLSFGLAVLALVSLGLALFAFSRPVTRQVTDNISYQQQGTFTYSAVAPPGIYTANQVQTGEPIFRQLINKLTINFSYRLESDLPGNFNGAYRLIAEVSHRNGWRRTLELQPETAFTGNSFSSSGSLDLTAVQTLLDSVEQQTGLQGQQYTLVFVPEVTVQGDLAGQALQDKYSPRLVLYLDDLQLQLARDTLQGADTLHDLLNPSQLGLLPVTRQAPNTLPIFGFQLKVSVARQLAVAGLVLALGGILIIWLPIVRAGQANEVSRIQAKYGSLLVNVLDSNLLASNRQLIEVATIDDLVRIAERDVRMILHQDNESTHHYFVQTAEVTYHYEVTLTEQQAAPGTKQEAP